MKRLVILNPRSRNGRAERDFSRMGCEKWLGQFDLYRTSRKGDATDRVREALQKGECDQILVAGGDGSINEAARGYWGDGRVIEREIPLGVINLGTGGDFHKTLQKSSSDYREALIENRKELVDSGRVDGEGFLNIASVGMAGEMLRRLKNSRFQAGAAAYLFHTLSTLVSFRPRVATIKWEDDSGRDHSKSVDLFNLFACNGCFSGGGMQWAPGASLTDGLLRVTLVSGTKKLPLALESRKVYAGRIEEYPGTECFAAKKVTVKCEDGFSAERDGEIIETESTELRFEILEKAFPLVL